MPRDPIYAPDGRTWYETLLSEAEKRGQLQNALEEIADIGHYPDSTIALRALGRPVTDREKISR